MRGIGRRWPGRYAGPSTGTLAADTGEYSFSGCPSTITSRPQAGNFALDRFRGGLPLSQNYRDRCIEHSAGISRASVRFARRSAIGVCLRTVRSPAVACGRCITFTGPGKGQGDKPGTLGAPSFDRDFPSALSAIPKCVRSIRRRPTESGCQCPRSVSTGKVTFYYFQFPKSRLC